MTFAVDCSFSLPWPSQLTAVSSCHDLHSWLQFLPALTFTVDCSFFLPWPSQLTAVSPCHDLHSWLQFLPDMTFTVDSGLNIYLAPPWWRGRQGPWESWWFQAWPTGGPCSWGQGSRMPARWSRLLGGGCGAWCGTSPLPPAVAPPPGGPGMENTPMKLPWQNWQMHT